MPLPPDSPASEVNPRRRRPRRRPCSRRRRHPIDRRWPPCSAAAAAPADADPQHADAVAPEDGPDDVDGHSTESSRSRPAAAARWQSASTASSSSTRCTTQHAELRPVGEQRDARAARDLRGPARAHADDREQLAVRRFASRAPRTPACARRGQVEVDFFGTQPSDATERDASTRAASLRMRLFAFRLETKLGDSTCCSPGSTTTCSPGAAPASTRTASRSSGSPGRSITATRRYAEHAGRSRSAA